MTTGITNGNCYGIYQISATFDPASVAAATSVEQTFTVNGLRLNDQVIVIKPTVTAGLSIAQARVSAANTLAITFVNSTASAIDAASEVYALTITRPEAQVLATAIRD